MNDFAAIFRLIDEAGGQVAGRSSREISNETRESLARLAAGKCNLKERDELLTLLAQNADLVPELIKEIRKLRTLEDVDIRPR